MSHDEDWLLAQLKEQGVTNIRDVYMAKFENNVLKITRYDRD